MFHCILVGGPPPSGPVVSSSWGVHCILDDLGPAVFVGGLSFLQVSKVVFPMPIFLCVGHLLGWVGNLVVDMANINSIL